MSAKGDIREFEPLPMRRRNLIGVDGSQYCIWTDGGEMQQIKADTAYEAVIKSGQKNIIKIERISNNRQNLIEKSSLKEEVAGPAEDASESPHALISRRRNPIISANELDELMQALRNDAVADVPPPEEAAINMPTEKTSVLAEPRTSQPADDFRPPVPPPQELLPPAEGVSPVGLDVHNDGFDEIIPAAPVKPSVTKPHHEPKETPITAQQTIAAEPSVTEGRELSADEVEKLLQGKPE